MLLVDASMHARSQQAGELLDSQAWLDRVLPEIAQSTAQGREIALASTAASPSEAQAAAAELAKVASQARATAAAVRSDHASSQVLEAAGLLEACLAARQAGAQEMASAASGLLRGDPGSSAMQAMTAAVSDFRLGDSAYQLFAKSLPPLGVTMPSSQWVDGAGTYSPSALGGLVRNLQAAAVVRSGQRLVVDTITTNPVALSMQGKTQVLSPAPTVSVTAIVSDAGGVAERGVTVTATITPAQGAPEQRMSTSVNLSAGQAYAVTFNGFRLVLDRPTTLSVSASAGPGATGGTSKSLLIEMPGPGFTGTSTTTTSVTPTTTVPATTAPATTAPATTVPATTAAATTAAATTTVATTAVATTTVPATTAPATTAPRAARTSPKTTATKAATTARLTTTSRLTTTTTPPLATTKASPVAPARSTTTRGARAATTATPATTVAAVTVATTATTSAPATTTPATTSTAPTAVAPSPSTAVGTTSAPGGPSPANT